MLRLTQAIGAEVPCHVGLFLRRTRSRLGRVNAIGLWPIAAESPDRTAVIEPGGAAVTYAELAREADRYGRGRAGGAAWGHRGGAGSVSAAMWGGGGVWRCGVAGGSEG